jgi:predicted enzyme related to lactoylglutathione lyase
MNEQSSTVQTPSPVVSWIDLTVADAEAIRDFYAAVAGWHFEPMTMGDHDDYVMLTGKGGEPVAGICHALGEIADYPPFWLPYFPVMDLKKSIERCVAIGGAVIAGPIGGDERASQFCVIRDPAGAFVALIEQAKPNSSSPAK